MNFSGGSLGDIAFNQRLAYTSCWAYASVFIWRLVLILHCLQSVYFKEMGIKSVKNGLKEVKHITIDFVSQKGIPMRVFRTFFFRSFKRFLQKIVSKKSFTKLLKEMKCNEMALALIVHKMIRKTCIFINAFNNHILRRVNICICMGRFDSQRTCTWWRIFIHSERLNSQFIM